MQDQPKAIVYRESGFFKDGTSARPLVEGTVPRGYLRADREYYLGKKANSGTATGAAATTGTPANPAAAYPDDVEELPIHVDRKTLDDGQDRYQIFCSSCHGLTGYGDGIVARWLRESLAFSTPEPANLLNRRVEKQAV